MNNTGLPGTGLGGLFYVLLAMAMPPVELYRTLRGRSSIARWRQVGARFAIACGVVTATLGSAAALVRVAGVPRPLGLSGTSLVLAPGLLAAAVLGCLVLALRIWAGIAGPCEAVEDGSTRTGPQRLEARSR